MKRNRIVVFVNRKVEIEMKTRCVLSIFPLGKGKIIVSGHIRQVTIITKRRGGRRKRATNKSAGILFIESKHPSLPTITAQVLCDCWILLDFTGFC